MSWYRTFLHYFIIHFLIKAWQPILKQIIWVLHNGKIKGHWYWNVTSGDILCTADWKTHVFVHSFTFPDDKQWWWNNNMNNTKPVYLLIESLKKESHSKPTKQKAERSSSWDVTNTVDRVCCQLKSSFQWQIPKLSWFGVYILTLCGLTSLCCVFQYIPQRDLNVQDGARCVPVLKYIHELPLKVQFSLFLSFSVLVNCLY